MTTAVEGGEWSEARPGRTLPPGKTRYPLYTGLGGPQGRSGRTKSRPTGNRSPKPNMKDRKLRSSVYWHGALKQKDVKQVGRKTRAAGNCNPVYLMTREVGDQSFRSATLYSQAVSYQW